MTSRSASESRVSPSAVEPFRSEKTIVTVFRTSAAAWAGARAVPQKPQRRNRSGFCSPQFGHVITPRVYGVHVTYGCIGSDARRPLAGHRAVAHSRTVAMRRRGGDEMCRPAKAVAG